MDIEEQFKKVNDDYTLLKFENIPEEEKLSKRPDLCGMIYLDKLDNNSNSSIVACAEHDQIWLSFSNFDILTDDDILYLIRCGIFIDEDSFSMFV